MQCSIFYIYFFTIIRYNAWLFAPPLFSKLCRHNGDNASMHTYIHTFIDHFPKGAFQCQLQRKKIKIKTYTNNLKLQLQIIRISFLPLKVWWDRIKAHTRRHARPLAITGTYCGRWVGGGGKGWRWKVHYWHKINHLRTRL